MTTTIDLLAERGELLSALRSAHNVLGTADRVCRIHGADLLRSGVRNGLPRCDSCRQPYRVAIALDRVGRAIAATLRAARCNRPPCGSPGVCEVNPCWK